MIRLVALSLFASWASAAPICTGTVTAFNQTWTICGNVTGGTSLTIAVPTGAAPINTLTPVSGPVPLPLSFNPSLGSAATLTFFAANPGTLALVGTTSFASSILSDAVLHAGTTAFGAGEGACCGTENMSGAFDVTMNYGAGYHTLVLVSLGDGPPPDSAFTITSFTLNAPEPATLAVTGAVLAGMGLYRRRR
jgi:hypothetical protein